MRVRTLGLSIAGHAVVGLVLAFLATHDRPARPTTTIIELVDAPVAAARVPVPVVASTKSGGGGTHARMRSPLRSSVRSAIEDPRGEVHLETGAVGDAEGNGEGDGRGDGRGDGHGTGFGLGDGAMIANETVALDTPPAPVASKARIAKLVYPVREREVDDSELFIMRVTIDDEGFVVGAKLVRGFGGPRDAMAGDLIWKFRYAPALDDEGHAIQSTFDQRFLVGR